MTLEPDFGQRLTRIYDAAFARDRWREALDAIQQGTQTAGMMFFDAGEQRKIAYHAHRISSSYAWIAAFQDEYNQMVADPDAGSGIDAEGAIYMHGQPAFRAVRDDEIWPLDDVYRARPEIRFTQEKLRYYRRFFVNLSEDPLSYTTLLAHYGVDHAGAPPTGDMRHAERLAPHLAKALELNRAMHDLRARHNAVLAALDLIDIPICILDEWGRVMLRNRRADRLFDGRDGIWIDRTGRLSCRKPADGDRLQDSAQRIARTAAGENADRSDQFEITRASRPEPLYAVLSPLRDADMELEPGLSGALVTIIDGAQHADLNVGLIARAYGLSPAEQRVARLVARGLSNAEIADRLNVSPETVKSQVSSLLSKTQSQSRMALVWRMFQFSPPIL